jgi:uncharacterized protein YkwD
MRTYQILTGYTRNFLLALLLSTINTCSQEDTITKKQFAYTFNKDELELMEIINKYRDSIGLEKLVINEHLAYVAAQHNNYMIQKKSINHNGFINRADELKQLLGATNVAENIAYNYNSNKKVLSAWLKSPNHKKNIEGNFTQFGLSITTDSTSQKKYYTNLFIKTAN